MTATTTDRAPLTVDDLPTLGWTIDSDPVTFNEPAGVSPAGRTVTRWRATLDGRTTMTAWTLDGLIRAALSHAEDMRPTRVAFMDGTVLEDVPAWAARAARGLDHEGRVVVEWDYLPGMTYALTDCCYAAASRTGSIDGPVCRSCGVPVPVYLGSQVAPTFPVAREG